MIPLAAIVHIRPQGGPRIKLWAPLFLLWLVLLPIAVVLSPLIVVGGAAAGVNPFKTLAAAGAVLGAMAGTHVEIEAKDASILVRLI